MKKINLVDLILLAILIALIAALSFIPNLGFIGIPFIGISITIIAIPIILYGLIFKSPLVIVLTLFFGLFSMLIAIIRPQTIIDPVFANPLVSVLPRVLFGAFIYLVSLISTKLIKDNKMHNLIIVAFSTFLVSFFHTLIVSLSLFVFKDTVEVLLEADISTLLIPLISMSGLAEAIFATIITILTYFPLVRLKTVLDEHKEHKYSS